MLQTFTLPIHTNCPTKFYIIGHVNNAKLFVNNIQIGQTGESSSELEFFKDYEFRCDLLKLARITITFESENIPSLMYDVNNKEEYIEYLIDEVLVNNGSGEFTKKRLVYCDNLHCGYEL